MSASGVLKHFAAATTRGALRGQNEDCLSAAGRLVTGEMVPPLVGTIESTGLAVMAVADGLGGHPHGDLASRETLLALAANPGRLAVPADCTMCIREVNLHLHGVMLQRPETMGMGATIAGVAIAPLSFCWFNVGDSRIYRVRGHRLEQLSVDDRELSLDLKSRRLGSSLGGRREIAPISPHVGEEILLAGDRLLLCSDGLSDMISNLSIEAIVCSAPDASSVASKLVEAALVAGGTDNITVMVLE